MQETFTTKQITTMKINIFFKITNSNNLSRINTINKIKIMHKIKIIRIYRLKIITIWQINKIQLYISLDKIILNQIDFILTIKRRIHCLAADRLFHSIPFNGIRASLLKARYRRVAL